MESIILDLIKKENEKQEKLVNYINDNLIVLPVDSYNSTISTLNQSKSYEQGLKKALEIIKNCLQGE